MKCEATCLKPAPIPIRLETEHQRPYTELTIKYNTL